MKIIPAIDIKNGKCVRLYKGDFAKETIYSNDPVAVARMWEKQGAERLHIVDLDGAKIGYMKNVSVVKKIRNAVSIPLQVGGGIRDEKTISFLLEIGVEKVILGTVALEDQAILKALLIKYSNSIVVALDAKKDLLVSQAWNKQSKNNIYTTAKRLFQFGVGQFIYTDVTKDGTLSSPNFPSIKKLLNTVQAPIIISGGVTSIDDLKKLNTMGVDSIIIGKALYEEKISLKEAKKYVS